MEIVVTDMGTRDSSNKHPPIARNITQNGKAISWIDSPLSYLRLCYKRYGDIFRIGSEENSVTVLGGLKSNKLLAKESKLFLSSNEFWSETLQEMECPHSFIGVDDEVHRYQRRLMSPMFSKSSFKDNMPEFCDTFKDILATQFEKTETLVSPFFRNTLSTQIGYALQGYSPTSEEVEALIEYQATVMNACSFKRTSKRILESRAYLKSKETVHNLAERIINSKTASGGRTRYIDVLINEGAKNRPEWFTPGDIRNHAIIPFLAGIDTVNSALSFAVRELLINPNLLGELKEEVSRLDLSKPELTVIDEMNKINAFMKEIMRLYPPAFAIYRVATNDFDFDGYRISKGEILIFFIASCHTDERFFPNPYDFNMDRFSNPDNIIAGSYAPFGKGPHTCVGAGLSNIILPLNLSILLRYADFDYYGDIDALGLDYTKPSLSLDPSFSIKLKPSKGHKNFSPC